MQAVAFIMFFFQIGIINAIFWLFFCLFVHPSVCLSLS